MSDYKVTEKDLIKDLEGFPIEVVEKMLERQKEQRGKTDITIFQANKYSLNGFDWNKTVEGREFWSKILHTEDFELFFTKYPKKKKYVYIYQDGTKNGKDIINTLIKYGGVDPLKYSGLSIGVIYYISPNNNKITLTDPSNGEGLLVKTFYTEIQPEPSVKEYTMQEIADKLGINVNELRIKK